jgi:hypothetical protein
MNTGAPLSIVIPGSTGDPIHVPARQKMGLRGKCFTQVRVAGTLISGDEWVPALSFARLGLT